MHVLPAPQRTVFEPDKQKEHARNDGSELWHIFSTNDTNFGEECKDGPARDAAAYPVKDLAIFHDAMGDGRDEEHRSWAGPEETC